MNEYQAASAQLTEKLAAIRWLVLDVDGVLTDGTIAYDSNQAEIKHFNIKDGLGIKLVQQAGIEVAIITGRVSPMVQRRADELGIRHLIQGREDKAQALREMAAQQQIELDSIAYMGDDLPDYAALACAGVAATVADGHTDVRAIADYVTQLGGGRGAVREFCDLLLRAQNQYDRATAAFKPL